MVAIRVWGLCLVLTLQLAAMGCDGDGDAKPADGGMDASMTPAPGTGLDFRDRRDAATAEGDPVPACQDRFDPAACGAGQQCDIVIRRIVGDEQFGVYTGCVEQKEKRGLGDPCVEWGGFADPYQAPGLIDEVHVDPCGAGLFCAPDPDIRGLFSCQRSCDSGQYTPSARSCSDDSQYCTGPGPLQEVCRPSHDCDPAVPGACATGEACYLRIAEGGTGVLTVCLPVPQEPVQDGMACMFINHCRPGSVCWGPSQLAPSRWGSTDRRCQRACDPGVAVDEDAGVSQGVDGCLSGQSCNSLSESLDLDALGRDLGQCED